MRKPRYIETEIADYCLDYGALGVGLDIENLEDFDAIVLETGFHAYEDVGLNVHRFRNPPLFDLVEKELWLDEPKPIFYVDVPPKKWLREKLFVGLGLTLLTDWSLIGIPFAIGFKNPSLAWPLEVPAISLLSTVFNGIDKRYDLMTNYLRLSQFYTSAGLRSAVSAKKIKDFVVPEIDKRNSYEEKPSILICYDAGHGDLEPYLKHDSTREFVIGLHHKLRLNILDYEYIDKIFEIRYKSPSSEPCSIDKIIYRADEPFLKRWERIVYKL